MSALAEDWTSTSARAVAHCIRAARIQHTSRLLLPFGFENVCARGEWARSDPFARLGFGFPRSGARRLCIRIVIICDSVAGSDCRSCFDRSDGKSESQSASDAEGLCILRAKMSTILATFGRSPGGDFPVLMRLDAASAHFHLPFLTAFVQR